MSSMASFHVTIKGVIYFEDKILILKKVSESKDGLGLWELPGGGMEFFESPSETMVREAKEEAGLDIEVIKPISTFYINRKDKQIVGIVFKCKALNNNLVLSHEHDDFKFVTKEEAKQYLDPKIYNDAFHE